MHLIISLKNDKRFFASTQVWGQRFVDEHIQEYTNGKIKSYRYTSAPRSMRMRREFDNNLSNTNYCLYNIKKIIDSYDHNKIVYDMVANDIVSKEDILIIEKWADEDGIDYEKCVFSDESDYDTESESE